MSRFQDYKTMKSSRGKGSLSLEILGARNEKDLKGQACINVGAFEFSEKTFVQMVAWRHLWCMSTCSGVTSYRFQSVIYWDKVEKYTKVHAKICAWFRSLRRSWAHIDHNKSNLQKSRTKRYVRPRGRTGVPRCAGNWRALQWNMS